MKIYAVTSQNCPPCRKFKRDMEAGEFEGLDIEIKDIQQDPEFAEKYKITSIPAFVKDDKLVCTGYATADELRRDIK